MFTAASGLWIGMTLAFVLIQIALFFVPIVGNLAQVLLGPVFVGGLLLGCHALAQGRPLTFAHLFAGFGEGRAGPLVILGLLTLLFSFVVGVLFAIAMLGGAGMTGAAGMLTGDPSAALSGALVGMGVGALVAVPILLLVYVLFMMVWWFAPALVTLNRAQALVSLQASFGASWQNLGALIVFLLIFMVLGFLASIPFGLGWIVLLPVAFGAMYASWREVFGE